jgi:GH15 family glucan-1,4-alpha-glucosidase
MARRIEDYALLSDTETAALVGNDGSIDWLCFPRFDSPACFSALLGNPENGRWQLAPAGAVERVERHYRDSSLVLETTFHTETGSVAVIDCLPPRDGRLDLIRVVEGRGGHVPMRMHLTVRFDYGSIVPWVRRVPGGLLAVAGPDAMRLATPVDLHGEDFATLATFDVQEGDQVPFSLTWFTSNEDMPLPIDALTAVAATEAWWHDWSAQCTYDGDYADVARRSLLVLKALTHAPTGGIVAAATTSLPELLGGERNWDYRYCWLRDATFSLMALQGAGYHHEAAAWRDWLLRAVAGRPDQLQIMYGPGGERRLTEIELDWLDGYEGSRPVRIGNAAHGQFQLDVYGEIFDALHQARLRGLPEDPEAWQLQQRLLEFVADHWQDPDDGLWEMRGPRRHFTHSKVMAWVAVDRAIRAVEDLGAEGPVDEWRALREQIRAEVLEKGVDSKGRFVQAYGSDALDASLLLIPLVGFLPADDERVLATVAGIERELTEDGFVRRYNVAESDDGLSGQEGVFLMCSFWLADNYALQGRLDEATTLYERLLGLRNDVGLLAEEYDPQSKRMLGNFPQAFSHVSLVNTAGTISGARELARTGRRDPDHPSAASQRGAQGH